MTIRMAMIGLAPAFMMGACALACTLGDADAQGDALSGYTGGAEPTGEKSPDDSGFSRLDNDEASKAAVPAAEKACASATGKATPLQLHLVVLVDRSGSMCQFDPADDCLSPGTQCNCQNPSSRWQQSLRALGSFFASKEATGIYASVIAFPKSPSFDLLGNGFCKSELYTSPIAPEIVLPDTAGKLRGALASLPGQGATPTRDALFGAAQWANAVRVKVGAKGRVAIVFATDGLPAGCADEGNLVPAAQVAQFIRASIPTYVIGVGDNLTGLNALAAAGGTGEAIFATGSGAAVGDKIAAALAKIRGSVVQCDYTLPSPPAGETLDPAKVNVNVTRAGANVPLTYSKDCSAKNAWKYDDAAKPTKLTLCKTTCDEIQKDALAAVSLQLGCVTRGEAPR